MKPFKIYLITFFLTFALGLAAHLGPLLLIDPLNLLPFDLTSNAFFIKTMRFQAGPLINKFNFNSAIVGTSMAENFSPQEASAQLGGQFLNLSLSGSLLHERQVVLNYFLKKKDVKTIILSLDGATTLQRNQGIPLDSWAFLYNDNPLDDMILYSNRKYSPYISCHPWLDRKLVRSLYGNCPDNTIRSDLETLTEWHSMPTMNSRFGGLEQWQAHRDETQVVQAIEQLRASRLNTRPRTPDTDLATPPRYDAIEFSTHIVPLIKQHPQTRFILFFPPYSIAQYAIDAQAHPHIFTQYLAFVERVVLETALYPNAEVYWFTHQDFTGNLANYKDFTHYHATFNSHFLEAFKHRRSLITIDNLRQRLTTLENQARALDLEALAAFFD